MPDTIWEIPMPSNASTGSERVRTMNPPLFIVLLNSCLKIRTVLFMIS